MWREYLLLRLRRFDLMKDWTRNLANWFEAMPDGAVLWAMQSLLEHKDRDAARRYLAIAIQRGLPVYTEGLRLLVDLLSRLEPRDSALWARVAELSGEVIWNSPLTAGFFPAAESSGTRPKFAVTNGNPP